MPVFEISSISDQLTPAALSALRSSQLTPAVVMT
jgi:hypothetical protein